MLSYNIKVSYDTNCFAWKFKLATSEEIEIAINRLRNEELIIIPREKNIRTSLYLGLKFSEYKQFITEEIKRLTVSDYLSGPEKDDDPKYTGDVWKFKKELFNKTFYFKMNFDTTIRVISCHISDYD